MTARTLNPREVMNDTANPRVFLRAALSGVLLYTSYFPMNLGFMAWFALIPWLSLVEIEPKPRRLYLHIWLGALVFCLPAMQWMRVAHPAMYGTWIVLACYTALYFVFAMALTRALKRRGVATWIAFPIVWVGLEYCRAHFPTGFGFLGSLQHFIGFPWYFLGHSQHDYLPLIQVADVTGVYGISFAIALVNAAIYQAIIAKSGPRLVPIGMAVAIVIGIVGYGFLSLEHEPFEVGPRVAALQGNIPQEVKMKKGEELLLPYLDLWEKALATQDASGKIDLTIWPETSCPDDWINEIDPTDGSRSPRGLFSETPPKSELDVELYRRGKKRGDMGRVLLGLSSLDIDRAKKEVWKFNSAILMDGRRFVAQYDKMHLVPFGEYVPLGSLMPFLKMFTPYRSDYSCRPGETWTRFPLNCREREYTFACIICYEDSEPYIPRQYLRGDNPVEFFVNISNDGWFRGTEEHEQHLAICRFRAVETRRSIVRAVNMGISAIIDSDGRVIALPGDSWSNSKAREGMVIGNVLLDKRSSIYCQFGDWLPLGCWMLLLVWVIAHRSIPTH